MAELRLVDVAVAPGGAGGFRIEHVKLDVAHHEFIVLVGPSGCGKSTLLRAVAGLAPVAAGEIWLDGQRVDALPPRERGVAMVFQNYALYPNMTVRENMGFALKLAKVPPAELATRVTEVARLLKLSDWLSRFPQQLSGGQRQRVAIGRAIVRKPKIFLFDEPLSNLDAALRGHMRIELMKLHKTLNATALYVTHDQIEAMTLADRIVLLSPQGVEQIGTPEELFDGPRNRYVAEFLGAPKINMLRATVGEAGASVHLRDGSELAEARLSVPAGTEVTLGVRPRHIELVDDAPVRGEVVLIERLGDERFLHIRSAASAEPLVVVVRGDDATRAGQHVALALPPASRHYFGADGEALV